MARKKKTIQIPTVEQVKRVLGVPLVFFTNRGEGDRDERDTSKLLHGYRAPPGRTQTFRDLDDWLVQR